MPVEEQVVSIFAGTRGYLDSMPVDADRPTSRRSLLDELRAERADVLDAIRDKREIVEETEEKLKGIPRRLRQEVRLSR